MRYDYETTLPELFNKDGLALVVHIWEKARKACEQSGAIKCGKLVSGDAWACIAAVDFLAKAGYLRYETSDCARWQENILVCP